MNIKSDKWLIDQYEKNQIIEPFAKQKVPGGISYGVSSYGYDARVANEFKIFTNTHCGIVDPKQFDEKNYIHIEENEKDHVLIPGNGFALARTVERFKIPRNTLVICLGKSTYARCGIIINVTPLEPEWEGYITIEISNTTPLPAKIYINEGICQCIFISSADDDVCLNSYADQKGKYMNQVGIKLPYVIKS
jgi:dCTP deaminase